MNTQDLIFAMWQLTISKIEDARIDDASAQMLIARTRRILREEGASSIDEHELLKKLRDALPILTDGHPICKQFITLLNRELECN